MAVLSNPSCFYPAAARMWRLNPHRSKAPQPSRTARFCSGANKLLARSGLVGLNQLCSLKLPQSPCSQGNGGGRKGKNSLPGLRVRGHREAQASEKRRDSPSEAEADANSGLVRSRMVCHLLSGLIRRCERQLCSIDAPSESAAAPSAWNRARPRSHFTEAPRDGGHLLRGWGGRWSWGGGRVKAADPQPGICSLNRGFCRRRPSPSVAGRRGSHAASSLPPRLQSGDFSEA